MIVTAASTKAVRAILERSSPAFPAFPVDATSERASMAHRPVDARQHLLRRAPYSDHRLARQFDI